MEEEASVDPFTGQPITIRKDLTKRLRGLYAIGPTLPSGEPEFGWRQYEGTPPIQIEAAERIEQLEAEVAKLAEKAWRYDELCK